MEKKLFFKNVEHRKDDDGALKPEIEGFLENREMYNLPGSPDITEKDIRRYTENNRKLYEKLPNIIQKTFQKGHWGDHIIAATIIPYVSEQQQKPLQEQCFKLCQEYLDNKDPFVREKALLMIPYIPIKKRKILIQKSLEDEDIFVCGRGVKMILYTLKSEQDFLRNQCLEIFQKFFKNKDPLFREKAAAVIPGAPVEKRAELIRKAYEEEKDVFVIIKIIKTISSVPIRERAELIQMFLKDPNPLVRKEIIRIVPFVLKERKRDFFQEALLDKNLDNRKLAETKIQNILEEEKTENEIQQIKEREEKQKNNPLIQELARRSLLYELCEDDKRFSNKNFLKDHSETTLLDIIPGQPEKSLRHRVIIRHIKPPSYFLWKKAYEAHQYWKDKGFDYVPVEPIVRVSHRKPTFDKVDIFTRVLNGPSVAMWEANNGPYQLEIEEQIRKIKGGLEELGVEHGHLDRHKRNFVLVFPRNEDGTVDLSHPPRAYAIDFDITRPKQKSEE